ncbi:hypothetical protein [Natrialba sp. SSL1]|uniref:hypothetical protein n=1 Tax=Natrialba sp. SSL1 TaxID=1869245 RepID=UPI0008F918B0|nr:hypothetical protein [Natrialba sp. SSL1]OIB57710.1 hypothetical protein BBD46_13060 [Natrialba sp. SSL1]
MSEDDQKGEYVSRRTVLQASGSAASLPVFGSGVVSADGANGAGEAHAAFERCPDATIRPSMGHCEGASMEGCADDHPVTIELRDAVQQTLETEYPDAGALLDAGFKPYFDTLDVADEDGWSHWLNPEFIGDDEVLHPERPESVLVDNSSWRSIGVMFIATRDGEAVEPPMVYDEGGDGRDDESEDDDHGAHHGDGNGEGDSHSHGNEDGDGHEHEHGDDEHGHGDHGHDEHEHDHGDETDTRCSPWHYHAGLPGRFAWWFYQQAYETEFTDGEKTLPCRTPCMMHVWTIDHPEGVYAHDAPPAEYREQPPVAEAGFETDADPGTDDLGWDALPEQERPAHLPHEIELPLLDRFLP